MMPSSSEALIAVSDERINPQHDDTSPSSSLPLPQPPGVATLRIICLHGANSNANQLQQALAHLDERLYEKHGIELVYVNSPLRCPPSESSSVSLREEPLRVWWEDGENYVGLDASLMLLRQIWTATPFCGILAVGQGAAVAAMLPFLMTKTTPLFGIFIQGETLLEDDELLMPDGSWPCLHMIDAKCESSQRLARQLGGHVHVVESNKISQSELNMIGKFLVEQKKRLRHDVSGYAIVLQNQLHMVEQQAAQLVAQRIAADPPRALMAVITPQAAGIGCWQRRQPNEEGGGAPCPSDFLLKREKRSAEPADGPSRHHPNAAANNDNTDATATVTLDKLDNDEKNEP